MEISLSKTILAIITTDPSKVQGSGVPVFICKDMEEVNKVAFNLGRITSAMIHDLGNGVYVAVRH